MRAILGLDEIRPLTQVFIFAVPPPEALRDISGTEVAEKFFKKVRSSLDGQGKCVKIFQGIG